MHVIMLAHSSWHEEWASRQNLALGMSRFVPVQYLWGLRGNERQLFPGPRRRRVGENLLYYGAPPWIPNIHWRPRLNGLLGAFRRLCFRRAIDRALKPPRVLYLWDPAFEDCVGRFGEHLLCYHMYDNQLGFQEGEAGKSRVAASEACLVERADLLVSTNRSLAERYGRLDDAVICPPGVAGVFIERLQRPSHRPVEMPAEGKILGYTGAIHEKIDFGCLELLASGHPKWHIVLIGLNRCRGQLASRFERLISRPNVRYLGPRPWHQLPDYVRYFDVGLLPYYPTEVSKWCELPAKVFEYLAAGLPVVEMALPNADTLDGVIRLAYSPEEFVHFVEEAMEADSPEAQAGRKQMALANTWEKRAATVLGAIRHKLCEKGWSCTVDTSVVPDTPPHDPPGTCRGSCGEETFPGNCSGPE